jgi:hypothetical protein
MTDLIESDALVAIWKRESLGREDRNVVNSHLSPLLAVLSCESETLSNHRRLDASCSHVGRYLYIYDEKTRSFFLSQSAALK